jgi:putative protease
MRKIELLAPAKTAEHGIEAVNHGADAVYIGAPRFSARANASNSLIEIEELIKHAHKYYAKVYVALNTILTDKELEESEDLIRKLYEIGTDALIIQDFGITQLNLPPIPLHASTQMDNRSVEKVKFLEKAGFEQVVLARELSIEQIREISKKTTVRLEAFVHGALCVSYSGQCYLSQSVCGRSANRGVCAQLCRLPYSLTDEKGNILLKDKYLLSLKDFNLSAHLKELLDAGVSSLKIEGRLKEVDYVKNVTAYYRQRLDEVLNAPSLHDCYQKASSGTCSFFFTPDVEKSFHRGSTDYFLHGRNKGITSFDTPKSLGEKIGTIGKSDGKNIFVKTDKALSNGDGFAFLNPQGKFEGFKANVAVGNKITPAVRIFIPEKTVLYRNFDQNFNRALSKKRAERKISAEVFITEEVEGFCFSIIDEDGNRAFMNWNTEKVLAENPKKQAENISQTLKKCGNTNFTIRNVKMETSEIFFIPATQLAEIRRTLIGKLEDERERNREIANSPFVTTHHPFPLQQLDYRGNIHNLKSKSFYQMHGVSFTESSLEQKEPEDAELMRCKHCIRYALGGCPKENPTKRLPEKLFLLGNNGQKLSLIFDCKSCEMIIKKKHK